MRELRISTESHQFCFLHRLLEVKYRQVTPELVTIGFLLAKGYKLGPQITSLLSLLLE